MRFCNQPEQGIDRWGIHDDAHSSRRILAVEFLAVECGSAVIHGDAQSSTIHGDAQSSTIHGDAQSSTIHGDVRTVAVESFSRRMWF